MDQNRLEQLALHCIPGIGSVTIRQLIAYCGSTEGVWKCSRKKLLSIPGIGPHVCSLLDQKNSALSRAREINRKALDHEVRILFHSDPEFPSRLRQIPDAPSLLFYRGNATLNERCSIGVIGTRRASSYGRELTEQLISELAAFNPLIISGLAYGIDSTAHRSSLRNGLKTIGVLAGGINRIYPTEHIRLADEMLHDGGLITEHPMDIAPEAHRFPARNRIIAGMADCVVITEARTTGGALITARLANDYNREVFAFPGPVSAPASQGCHLLIRRNQAHLITSAQDLAEIMGWNDLNTAPSKIHIDEESLPVPERRIYAFLGMERQPRSIDQICWSTNLSIYETATALLQLEFKGLVRSLPGKQYSLT